MTHSKHNAFRNNRVHVLSKKCDTCIFRPGNKMNLNEGRVADMVAKAVKNESAIICHATLGTGADAVCRGFHDVHGDEVATMRLAKALDVIEWQDPPSKDQT